MMNKRKNLEHQLKEREWVWIILFFAFLFSLVCIAYVSDEKMDREVESYLRSQKAFHPSR